MTKRKAIEYAKKHCACSQCKKFFTEENKKPCIKKHPMNVMVRWDIVMKIIDVAIDK